MGIEKIKPFSTLQTIRERHPGEVIVHCHGVYDLLHIGHIHHLRSAKEYGDILVVTVTPDQHVNKGPHRPRFTVKQRMEMLAAVDMVDYVVPNTAATAVPAIESLAPDFYVKGPDYKDKESDLTGGITLEEKTVAKAGGKLVFTDDDTESSTELINSFLNEWSDAQQSAIDAVRGVAAYDDVIGEIEAIKDLNILVIGEPIIDEYVFCEASGISSKNPTVAARQVRRENYSGGSLAIANHLASLGAAVTLLVTHGDSKEFTDVTQSSLNKTINLVDHFVAGCPTPRKTRFLVEFRAQNIFEIIDLPMNQWAQNNPAEFIKSMQSLSQSHDLIVAADFGHGLFEDQVLREFSKLQTFTALNVQTNSGNFGFNPFTKHGNFDYLSIDEKECRIATHDRLTPTNTLIGETVRGRIKRPTSITLGTSGSAYFDATATEHRCPTFVKHAVDTLGAGDAYFAITSALQYLDTPAPIIPFVGNCFAGLKTQIIGNKSAVAKIDLIRTIASILK